MTPKTITQYIFDLGKGARDTMNIVMRSASDPEHAADVILNDIQAQIDKVNENAKSRPLWAHIKACIVAMVGGWIIVFGTIGLAIWVWGMIS